MDEEDSFCLPYAFQSSSYDSDNNIISYVNLAPDNWYQLYNINDLSDPNDIPFVPKNPEYGQPPRKALPLNSIHYHQKRGDSFTSANPFPDLMAGDAPSVDISSLIDIVTTIDNVVTQPQFKVDGTHRSDIPGTDTGNYLSTLQFEQFAKLTILYPEKKYGQNQHLYL